MNLKPINDQVIVLPDPRPEKIGAIYLPDAIRDAEGTDNPNWFPETGRIVALGRTAYTADGEAEQPFDFAVGDRVHFNRYAGKQVTCPDDRVTYLVMREHEIDMVIDAETIFHGYEEPRDADVASYDRDPFAGL